MTAVRDVVRDGVQLLLAALMYAIALPASAAPDAPAASGGRIIPSPRPTNAKAILDAMPRDYPAEARKAGVAGYALVQFTLPESGRAEAAVVLRSEPQGVFDELCLRYASRLTYQIPAEWLAANPDRRHELACIFEVTGGARAPAFEAVPGMDSLKVSVRRR